MTTEPEGGVFGPWTVPEPALSLNEIKALPDGTEVEVVWSGGNGPHRGRVTFDASGGAYYVPLANYGNPDDPLRFYNPLNWAIGPRPLTEVRLVPDGGQDHD